MSNLFRTLVVTIGAILVLQAISDAEPLTAEQRQMFEQATKELQSATDPSTSQGAKYEPDAAIFAKGLAWLCVTIVTLQQPISNYSKLRFAEEKNEREH